MSDLDHKANITIDIGEKSLITISHVWRVEVLSGVRADPQDLDRTNGRLFIPNQRRFCPKFINQLALCSYSVERYLQGGFV
jgi:hypothetical protein